MFIELECNWEKVDFSYLLDRLDYTSTVTLNDLTQHEGLMLYISNH